MAIRSNKGARVAPASYGGQDFRAVVRYGDRVLELRGQGAVSRDDGHTVGLDRDVAAAEGEHRLDRQADPRHELHPPDAGPIVRNLRLFVHLRADAVADELPDDAVAVGR